MTTTPPLFANNRSPTPDLDLAIARICALNCLEVGQNILLDLLVKLKYKNSEGKTLTLISLKYSFDRLAKINFLERQKNGAYKITDAKRNSVLLDLMQSPDLGHWIVKLRDHLPKGTVSANWMQKSAEYCWREILWTALIGDVSECEDWLEELQSQNHSLPTVTATLFKDDAGRQLFTSLLTPIQALLLRNVLAPASALLTDCKTAYEYALDKIDVFKQWPQFLGTLGSQAMLRGNFIGFHSANALMPETEQSIGKAIYAVLQGDYVAANRLFEQAAKLQRGEKSKRRVYFEGLPGMLYALACVGENTPLSLKTAKAQV